MLLLSSPPTTAPCASTRRIALARRRRSSSRRSPSVPRVTAVSSVPTTAPSSSPVGWPSLVGGAAGGIRLTRRLTRGRDRAAAVRPPSAFWGSAESSSAVLAVLASCAAGAKLAEENTRWGAATSAPLLAMASAMGLSVLGVLPPASVVYDVVWAHVMPLAVVLSLLGADAKGLAGRRTGVVLAAFAVGAVGTVVGTAVAFTVVGPRLGPEGWKVAACLCGSYVGGSLNYAAVAQALGLSATAAGQAALAAGMAADNLAMAGFLACLMAWPAAPPEEEGEEEGEEDTDAGGIAAARVSGASERAAVRTPSAAPTVCTMAASLAAAAVVLEAGASVAARAGLPGGGLGAASLLAPCASAAITAMARRKRAGGGEGEGEGEEEGGIRLETATKKTEGAGDIIGAGGHAGPFHGADALGGALMLVFFAALGASADPRVAVTAGGPVLAFISLQLAAHLACCLLVGRKLLRLPAWALLTASNANVGGPATAAAMAAARGWAAAVQPAVLTGTIGYVVGTPLGCVVGQALRSFAGAG